MPPPPLSPVNADRPRRCIALFLSMAVIGVILTFGALGLRSEEYSDAGFQECTTMRCPNFFEDACTYEYPDYLCYWRFDVYDVKLCNNHPEWDTACRELVNPEESPCVECFVCTVEIDTQTNSTWCRETRYEPLDGPTHECLATVTLGK